MHPAGGGSPSCQTSTADGLDGRLARRQVDHRAILDTLDSLQPPDRARSHRQVRENLEQCRFLRNYIFNRFGVGRYEIDANRQQNNRDRMDFGSFSRHHPDGQCS